MRNFRTSIINAITENLRNRYSDGFPILKELIQNADDAQAERLIFGWHDGFHADSIDHPLLQGPALWSWNNGRIKPGDVESLCSFGINAKAADSGAIGKFGLGMKSVFHLCEAFFFLAWDGEVLRKECLSPWDQEMHPDWMETEGHWQALLEIGEGQFEKGRTPEDHWFLLWLPLRQTRHLVRGATPTAAIVKRFPGDNPADDLGFLREKNLAMRLGEMMPLLHHLTDIEMRGDGSHIDAFSVTMEAPERLEKECSNGSARGRVVFTNDHPALSFSGQQQSMPADPYFLRLKARQEWPANFVRNEETGIEEQKPDKVRPEAAVLFSRATDSSRLTLRWAVFLPLTEREESRSFSGESHFRVTLHGQFFVDSGRKDVHDWEGLFGPLSDLPPRSIDDSTLWRAWNAGIFQRVLAPLFLPALEDFVRTEKLSDFACRSLTQAIAQTDVYRNGQRFLCQDADWCRSFDANQGAEWSCVTGRDRGRLRPVPTPPDTDTARPWKVFTALGQLGIVPLDRSAARLSAQELQWQEQELQRLLGDVAGVFEDGQRMAYLADFLEAEDCARPYLQTDWCQRRLVQLVRHALLATNQEAWRKNAEKGRRLIALVEPARRHSLDTDLGVQEMKQLLRADVPFLLVPKGLSPQVPKSALRGEEQALHEWLRAIDRVVSTLDPGASMDALLDVATGLLKTLADEARGAFLRIHSGLRVIAVEDVTSQTVRASSPQWIQAARESETLFTYAGGLGRGRLGLLPVLADALCDARLSLIRADRYRDLFPGALLPGRADSEKAVLAAVGRYGVCVGEQQSRQRLLSVANDPSDDSEARRGLRFLLHGSSEHRLDDDSSLWVPRHGQHPAWACLWGQLHSDDRWSLIERSLAGCVPGNRWPGAGIEEIGPESLIAELKATGRGVPAADALSVEDRDEILSNVDDRDLWRRLPLHTSCDGHPVSLTDRRAYLAPPGGCSDDALTAEAVIIARSPNPVQAEKQARREWLASLDDRAIIEIALESDEPECHFLAVMDAFKRLEDRERADLLPGLRSIRWLPTKFDASVSPEDVIDLPAALHDDAVRLVVEHREAYGPCFAVPDDLDGLVHEHPGYERLAAEAFSMAESGLERLSLLLQELTSQHIGAWGTAPSENVCELLADYEGLSGWRLLRRATSAFASEIAWQRLRDGLSLSLTSERILGALAWITSAEDDWETRKRAGDEYLRQLVSAEDCPEGFLERIRLANRARAWERPDNLCAGAQGVELARVLDESQRRLLGGRVQSAERGYERDSGAPAPHTEVSKRGMKAAPEALRTYFATWRGLVAPPMIGVVIVLLGPRVRNLAADLLQPHSFGWLHQRLSWTDPGRDSTGRLSWMGECNLADALSLIHSSVAVVDGETVQLPNLLGQQLQFPLQSVAEMETLVAGAPFWKGGDREDGYRVKVLLRRIDPTEGDPDRLVDLLRRTAEYLYRHFYNQPRPSFASIWQELDRTDQLEINIARRLVLEHIPFYLRQLSLRASALDPLLSACDEARRRLVEQEEHTEVSAAVDRRPLIKALAELGDAIEKDPEIQGQVLSGVRRRVTDSQYQQSSIPFELFQNADDAVVELGHIDAYPDRNDCDMPPDARHLVVEIAGDRLRFMHWGRALNDRGPPGFGGDARGFGRDLEKMLVLSASDKSPDEGVTGRLGLGFKSVLLACDRPRILSGKLAVEIVGGLLPVEWSECGDARACLTRHGQGATLCGTLIELSPMEPKQQREVLARFRRLAAILCVFARAIRQIRTARQGNVPSSTFDLRLQWSPEILGGGLELGQLRIRGVEWGDDTTALCVRASQGSLLLALGPFGFRPLPDDVPVIWVTAPTAEKNALGFAVNGPFALDPGRARLAGDSTGNLELARGIGVESGAVFSQLLEWSVANWSDLREQLELSADLGIQDFWLSVWLGLTKAWLGKTRDAAGNVAREVVVAMLGEIATSPESIPNGLCAPLASMVSRDLARYELAGPLAKGPIISVIATWPRFAKRYPATELVGEAIGAILKHCGMAAPVTVGPKALVALIDDLRVDPGDAEALGGVLLQTEDDIDWTKGELRESLQGLQFRSQAGTWIEPRHLLTDASSGSERDTVEERLRYGVAPPDRRLDPAYFTGQGGDAIAWFFACRLRFDAPISQLARWILAAQDETSKIAALRLLVGSERGVDLSALVRGQGWLAGILNDIPLISHSGLSEADIGSLRRLLASDVQIQRAIVPLGYNSALASETYSITLDMAIQRIHDWWQQSGGQLGQEHRQALYPQQFQIRLEADLLTGDYDRGSWLALFALGAFQGLPWTRDDLNRTFLERCWERQWWDTFAGGDPHARADDWMEILANYAEGQTDDQEWALWMGQFPSIYRLARWLDEYRELFLSINSYTVAFDLEEIKTPRASYVYQGGGIDAPPVNRTLKHGGNLVVRELLHHGIITNAHAVPHAYAPIQRIRSLFWAFGAQVDTSEDIYRTLEGALGAQGARFNDDFDIPLRIIAQDSNRGLRATCFSP